MTEYERIEALTGIWNLHSDFTKILGYVFLYLSLNGPHALERRVKLSLGNNAREFGKSQISPIYCHNEK